MLEIFVLTFFLSHFERIRRFFSELLRAKLRYFRQRCSVLGSLKCITVLRVLINSAVSTFCQHWRPNEISWSKNQDSSRLVFILVASRESHIYLWSSRVEKSESVDVGRLKFNVIDFCVPANSATHPQTIFDFVTAALQSCANSFAAT